ncbi:MAG: hypothetical protein IPJ69_15035 [Deltaproteobacteria bacterium]|nr:MAG: hypothetical protein IPJ69_15035 [Deltaproteobacteria bacterium]
MNRNILSLMMLLVFCGGCIYSSTPPTSSDTPIGGGIQSGDLPDQNSLLSSSASGGQVVTSGSLRAVLSLSPGSIQGVRTSGSLSMSDPSLERTVRNLVSGESSQP